MSYRWLLYTGLKNRRHPFNSDHPHSEIGKKIVKLVVFDFTFFIYKNKKYYEKNKV